MGFPQEKWEAAMRNSMFRFLAVATALALAPALAAAKGPHGNPHGGGGAKFSDHDSDDQGKHAKGHGDHDRDDDRDGDHDRDDRGRPPGWSKGKKTGWGNCDVPPGQVKKLGCHPRNHTVARRHGDGDHDRDDRNRPVATIPPRPVRGATPIPIQRRQQAATRGTTTTTSTRRTNIRRSGSKTQVLDQGPERR